jgi:hypothetical protein
MGLSTLLIGPAVLLLEEAFDLVLPHYWVFDTEVFDLLCFMFMGGASETINKQYCCWQGPNYSEYGWSRRLQN